MMRGLSMGLITLCVDIIAHDENGHFVLLDRLSSVPGLAWPGGKVDPGESLEYAVHREFFEETGMQLDIEDFLGSYCEAGRDPRGRYVSLVFIGRATGVPRDENGKTKVRLMLTCEVIAARYSLVFDHAQMFDDYLNR